MPFRVRKALNGAFVVTRIACSLIASQQIFLFFAKSCMAMPLNGYFCIRHEKTYCAYCFAEQAPFVQLEMLDKQSVDGRKKGGANLSGIVFLDGKRRKDGQYSIWRFFVLPIKMMGL